MYLVVTTFAPKFVAPLTSKLAAPAVPSALAIAASKSKPPVPEISIAPSIVVLPTRPSNVVKPPVATVKFCVPLIVLAMNTALLLVAVKVLAAPDNVTLPV